MPNIQFVPECHAETEMIRVFLQEHDFLNHAPGISSVCSALKSPDVKGYINIGLIDNDKKNVPRFFDEFVTLRSSTRVSLKKHPGGRDYLFVVNPAMEKFILGELEELRIAPVRFGMPENFKEFRRVLKNSNLSGNENYRRMIRELVESGSPGFTFISECIEELRQE